MGPRKVKAIENVWIPMPDGVRIAARLWLPEDAEQNPVPAIMEYIPYRKRDGTRLRDESDGGHAYYASYGYACIRPDIRGSGDSEGRVLDEYVRQEQDDGVEIIAWLAKQPWCTGKVGMFGKSWSGFNSLQIAARHPEALKCIIAHCSADDRYTDDAHYMGGCIIQDMFIWGSMLTTYELQPPDPAIVGPRWRENWLDRLDKLDFYMADWLTHQHRDAFWKQGSVDENYSDIKCAVYAVGGWVDSYNCAVPRLLANLKGPRKGLIGPWGHNYPSLSAIGPSIDWFTEALRWWDHWLKDVDTGIMDEPMYRVWMQTEEAKLGMRQVAGRWVAEEAWPSPRIKPRTLYLTDGGIENTAAAEVSRVLAPLQTVGVTAPSWCPFEMDVELPADQRIDDARSLTFDSNRLTEDLEIMGAPVVTLDLAVDKPVAFLAVRLNEVAPDGESTRVTYAVLNLTHRDSDEFPAPLVPGARYRVRVQLRDRAHVVKAGNRLRVAISTTHWPMILPSPEAVTLMLYAGASTLELPVRPPRPDDANLHPFGEPFVPESSGSTPLRSSGLPALQRKVHTWDVAAKKLTITSSTPLAMTKLNAIGTETGTAYRELLEISDNDPTSVRIEYDWAIAYKRDDWNVEVKSALRFGLTKDDFLLRMELEALEHEKRVYARAWERKIPRRWV